MRVPVVYLTGDSDQKTLERAKSASAYGYVLKPFHIRNLIVAIEVALDRFEMERRLEDSRLTYATILGSISDGVIAADTHGRVRFMNAVAERLTGWSNREAEGEPVGTVLKVTDSRGDVSALDLIARVLASKTPAAFGRDTFAVNRAGVRVPVDGGVSCIVDGLGRVVGASIALRDVTHARKAESDLRAMAEQLRVVVDTAVDGVLMFDASGTILMLNPACERLFGYTSLELTGSNIEALMPSPLPAAERQPAAQLAEPSPDSRHGACDHLPSTGPLHLPRRNIGRRGAFAGSPIVRRRHPRHHRASRTRDSLPGSRRTGTTPLRHGPA